ncbi:MAG: autotransporter outer membrane beta-barrel domain-containing protein [Bacteroidales bacterium]|nr:autotransporter outer membrane beta-barrel domain-containing protein [Bacteroidales bacterium]
MRKSATLMVALFLGAVSVFAQDRFDYSGRWNIAVQGGTMFSINENVHSYTGQGNTADLFTYQGGLALGYDINQAFGVRLSVSYGKNVSASNYKQTKLDYPTQRFPYEFHSVNVFADAILNINEWAEEDSRFSPKVYAGVGFAETFGFKETGDHHPWQWDNISKTNTPIGFRVGAIGEYDFSNGLGIYIDVVGEAYMDNYNGIHPETEAHGRREGYAGFPLDLRALASFGVIYHF